nr:F-box only protein 36 [Oncorhynchus nerka]
MASLLGKKVFEINGQGPPPTKDFFQLTVTKTEVIWRSWKISLRIEFKGAAPGENKMTHDDFLHDARMQQQVGVVFGQQILQYTQALCQGNFDYLERLPNDLLLQILAFLELKDVAQLAQTAKRFHKLCNSPEFWEQTVRGRCDELTPDMEALANAMGWRKIFFAFFNTKEHQQYAQGGS